MTQVRLTDAQIEAYEAGWQSGLKGECPNSVCPYGFGHDLQPHWVKGWFDGDRATDREAVAAVGRLARSYITRGKRA